MSASLRNARRGLLAGLGALLLAGPLPADELDEPLKKAIAAVEAEVRRADPLAHAWTQQVRAFVTASATRADARMETLTARFARLRNTIGPSRIWLVANARRTRAQLETLASRFESDHATLRTLLAENKIDPGSTLVAQHAQSGAQIQAAIRTLTTIIEWEAVRTTLQATARAHRAAYQERLQLLRAAFGLRDKIDQSNDDATRAYLARLRTAVADARTVFAATRRGIVEVADPSGNAGYARALSALRALGGEARRSQLDALARFTETAIVELKHDVTDHRQFAPDLVAWPEGPAGELVDQIDAYVASSSRVLKAVSTLRRTSERAIRARNLGHVLREATTELAAYEAAYDRLLTRKVSYAFSVDDFEMGIRSIDDDLARVATDRQTAAGLIAELARTVADDDGDAAVESGLGKAIGKIKVDLKLSHAGSVFSAQDATYLQQLRTTWRDQQARRATLLKLTATLADPGGDHARGLHHFAKKQTLMRELRTTCAAVAGPLARSIRALNTFAGHASVIPEPTVQTGAAIIKALAAVNEAHAALRLARLPKLVERFKTEGARYGLEFEALSEFVWVAHAIKAALTLIGEIDVVSLSQVEKVMDASVSAVSNSLSVVRDRAFAELLKSDPSAAHRRFDAAVPELRARIDFTTFEQFEAQIEQEYLAQLAAGKKAYDQATGLLARAVAQLSRVWGRVSYMKRYEHLLELDDTLRALRKEARDAELEAQQLRGAIKTLRSKIR